MTSTSPQKGVAKGTKVIVEEMGRGVVLDSYLVKGKRLYHIKQGEYTLGNIPEAMLSLPTPKSK